MEMFLGKRFAAVAREQRLELGFEGHAFLCVSSHCEIEFQMRRIVANKLASNDHEHLRFKISSRCAEVGIAMNLRSMSL